MQAKEVKVKKVINAGDTLPRDNQYFLLGLVLSANYLH